jgi:hypothetical protein
MNVNKIVDRVIRSSLKKSEVEDKRKDTSKPWGFVIMIDHALSGWGKAAEGRSYYVIAVDSQKEADVVMDYAKSRSEMKNVRLRHYLPKISDSDHMSIVDKDIATAWFSNVQSRKLSKKVKAVKFEELDDDAKEKAREWYRDGGMDYEWWDGEEDYFKEEGKKKGFDIDTMYFTGFSSQGDGASWEGQVDLLEFIKGHNAESQYPKIMQFYIEMGGENYEPHAFNITVSGRYSHSNTMSINSIRVSSIDGYEGTEDWSNEEINAFDETLEKELTEVEEWALEEARAYADEYYRSLEKVYDSLMSDESVDANIMNNGYEFNEDGSIL